MNPGAKALAVGLAALIPALGGCASGAKASQALQERGRQELLAADAEFSQESVRHGFAAAFARFTNNESVVLPANSEPIYGREAIRRSLEGGDGATVSWKPVAATVARGGDLGYTWGVYEVRSKAVVSGTAAKQGKYLTVWSRQPDGTWKVAADIGNEKAELKP